MLSRTLKMAFWICYDHLGKLLLVNVLCVFLLLIPLGGVYAVLWAGDPRWMLWAGGPLLALTAGALLPAEAAALAYMIKELIDTRDGSVALFFTGLRQYALRGAGLGVLFGVAWCCLATSMWFYAARVGVSVPWLGYALSALALWCWIFVSLAALFVLPALVQKKAGVAATLKLSALLVLDNPFFSAGLAACVLFVMAFWLLPPVLLFFSLAPLMALVSSAYELLSRRYAAIEAHRALGDTAKPLKIYYNDEEDDYLNRGFRDFLFPWKG